MILFPELLPLAHAQGGAYLMVKVTPKASRSRCAGLYTHHTQSVLKVFVTAPPENGQANEAVLHILSMNLKLARARFSVIQGHTTSLKKIFIKGCWEEIVQSVGNIL